MAAKQLGLKVLTKIQNLISEIDKPSNLSSARNHKNKDFSQGIEQYDKNRVYSKMSYNFRKMHNKIDQNLKGKVYEEQKEYQKFKITNRATLKILNNKSIKPIYERIDDIVQKKNKFIRYQQLHFEERQKEAMKPLHQSIDGLIGRKYNESQLEQYREEIDTKNKERIKKRNMSKLDLVKKQQLQIPSVNKASRSLSSKRNLRKNYSDNVFKRMMQYNFEESTKKKQLLQTRRKQQGNFEPVLCSKSIQIAQKLKKMQDRGQYSWHHHSHCQIQKQSKDKSLSPSLMQIKSTNRMQSKQKMNKSIQKSINKSMTKSENKPEKKQVKKHQSFTPLKQKTLNSTTIPTKSKQKQKIQNNIPQKKQQNVVKYIKTFKKR